MKVYDRNIRSLLVDSFYNIEEYVNQDTIVVNEMDICSGLTRADVAVINGKLHGYEIKSKQDNLERLPQQVESYCQVFDTMTIVAFENHIDKIKEIIPSWWGIKSVSEKEGQIRIKNVRKGRLNKTVDMQSVAMLLWREEMIELLTVYGNVTKGYMSKTRSQLSEMIIANVQPEIIADYVRATLKSRKDWKAERLQQPCDD